MSWLYIPSKSAQAWACLVKDCELGSDTWASRIAPCATLSGKHTPPASWQRAWKKAPWTRHLSGLIYSPSTVQLGVDLWIASLRDSHAKTLALRGGALGLTVPGPASSSTSSTLPTIAVRGACFWRTSQASLLPPPPLWTKPKGLLTKERPPESWENWPTAGGMRSGSLFQRPTWAPVMGGHGGSALHGENWTTPTALERSGQGERNSALTLGVRLWMTPKAGACGSTSTTSGRAPEMATALQAQVTYWATPTSNEHTGAGHPDSKQGALNLRSQVSAWPTPRGTDGTKGGPNQAGSKGDLMLPSAASQWNANSVDSLTPQNLDSTDARIAMEKDSMMWPTPDAAMHGGSNTSPGPAGSRPNISLAAAQWPTPAARDSKGQNSEEHATVTGGGGSTWIN